MRGGTVGEDVDFYNVLLDNNGLYKIGSHVTMTQCRLLTHDACLTKTTGCVRIAPITIGDNVFVGADSVILPNTHIGSKVIIGAGAVVAHDIPDNSVAVGNPARIICTYDELVQKEYERIKSNDLVEKGAETLEMFDGNNGYKYVAVRLERLEAFMEEHK